MPKIKKIDLGKSNKSPAVPIGIVKKSKTGMNIQDMFEVGEIMEWEDKTTKDLTGDDCEITGKALNKNKVILHMKRLADGCEGNVFVRLKEEFSKEFPISKKLLGSKKVIGLTLNQFKSFNIEGL